MGLRTVPHEDVDLAASVEQLRDSAARLNTTVDQIALSVRTVEESLRKWNVGHVAGALVDLGKASGLSLAYQKVGQGFRIVVHYRPPFAEQMVKPWSDCDRDTKLQTIGHLPALIAMLAQSVRKRVETAAATATRVKQIANSLSAIADEEA